MIKTATVYVIECDGEGCGFGLERHADEPHFETREDAEARVADALEYAGWIERGEKLYCFWCAEKLAPAPVLRLFQ